MGYRVPHSSLAWGCFSWTTSSYLIDLAAHRTFPGDIGSSVEFLVNLSQKKKLKIHFNIQYRHGNENQNRTTAI